MRGKIVWWGELFREEKEKEGRRRGQENIPSGIGFFLL